MPLFYRIVQTDPPTLHDFLSDQDRRKPQPISPAFRAVWDGLSVMDSEAGAREMVGEFPRLGAFIAAVDVPDGGSIRYARTLRRPGHHTLWGEPTVILERVTRVVRA